MFVSITRPDQIKDRNTQRKINRHVMKPIGMARRRKQKNEKMEVALKSVETPSSTAVVPWQADDNIEFASRLYMQSIPSPMSADQELNYRHFSGRAHKIIAFCKPNSISHPLCRDLLTTSST